MGQPLKTPETMDVRWTLFGARGPTGFWQDWLFFALIWSPAGIAVFTWFMTGTEHFWRRLLINILIGEICFTVSFLGGNLLSALDRLWHRHRRRPYQERSNLIHIIQAIPFMLPGLHLAFLAMTRISPVLTGRPFHAPDLDSYKYGMLLGIFSAAIFLIVDFNRRARQSDHHIHALERENLQAQLAALTARMNPHLLFNTLNTIAATINDSKAQAEALTVDLADFYRGVLKASQRDRHRLTEELAICRGYLSIESARFGDRLRWRIETDAAVDGRADLEVPVLCLQPLIENSVKHGLAPLPQGGTIVIQAHRSGESLTLMVRDDGVGPGASSRQGTGTAIANCRQRLALLYGAAGGLELISGNPGTIARLTLPWPAAEPTADTGGPT